MRDRFDPRTQTAFVDDVARWDNGSCRLEKAGYRIGFIQGTSSERREEVRALLASQRGVAFAIASVFDFRRAHGRNLPGISRHNESRRG